MYLLLSPHVCDMSSDGRHSIKGLFLSGQSIAEGARGMEDVSDARVVAIIPLALSTGEG